MLLNSPTVELLTLRKADLLLVLDCGSCGQKPYGEDSRCSLALSRPDGAGFVVLRITVVARWLKILGCFQVMLKVVAARR